MKGNNKVLLFNHMFWPDNLNTARHISELCEELVKRKWDVTAIIGNRSYVNHKKTFKPSNGVWKGVKYNRTFTPPLNQKKNIERLLTSFWLIISWIFKLPFLGKYDAIIIGTNPPFSFLFLPFLRLFNRKSKILLWGFDVYPEAIYVTQNKPPIIIKKILYQISKFCYKRLDVIVDIGPCMRGVYEKYKHHSEKSTLTPWSFLEPEKIIDPHGETRTKLFNKNKLTLLYTGTIGNAHEFNLFLKLARYLRIEKASIGFCFAGFGNRFNELQSQITEEDTNITFAGFVETDKDLENRISAADIMLISLKNEWTGVSVPSKFFSALAMGKAVLFSGSKKSALSIWTDKHKLGFVLNENNIKFIGNHLVNVSNEKKLIQSMKLNSFNTYQKIFSKKTVCDKWSELLHKTINK